MITSCLVFRTVEFIQFITQLLKKNFLGWAFKKDTNCTRVFLTIYIAADLINEKAKIMYMTKSYYKKTLLDLDHLETRNSQKKFESVFFG